LTGPAPVVGPFCVVISQYGRGETKVTPLDEQNYRTVWRAAISAPVDGV